MTEPDPNQRIHELTEDIAHSIRHDTGKVLTAAERDIVWTTINLLSDLIWPAPKPPSSTDAERDR